MSDLHPIPLEPDGSGTRGRRWTPEQRELAYQHYRGPGERSLRKTAEAQDIPLGTLQEWSVKEKWQARLVEEDRAAREEIHARAAGLRAAMALDGLLALHAIIKDREAPAHARVDAAKYLAGLDGHVPVQRGDLLVRRDDPDLPELSPEELAKLPVEELVRRQRLRVFGQGR